MLNLRNSANGMLDPGALGHFILSAIATIGNLSAIEVAMIAPGSFCFFLYRSQRSLRLYGNCSDPSDFDPLDVSPSS